MKQDKNTVALYVDKDTVNIYKASLDLYEFAKQMGRSGLLEEYPTWLQGLRNILAKAEEK